MLLLDSLALGFHGRLHVQDLDLEEAKANGRHCFAKCWKGGFLDDPLGNVSLTFGTVERIVKNSRFHQFDWVLCRKTLFDGFNIVGDGKIDLYAIRLGCLDDKSKGPKVPFVETEHLKAIGTTVECSFQLKVLTVSFGVGKWMVGP